MSDWKQLVQNVKQLALKHPTAVYSSENMGTGKECFYTAGAVLDEDGNKVGVGCIIGQALSKMNVDFDLVDYDKDFDGVWSAQGVAFILDYHFDDIPPREYELLCEVQAKQDTGSTWGQAWRLAESYVDDPR